jgi:hypothetical protein
MQNTHVSLRELPLMVVAIARPDAEVDIRSGNLLHPLLLLCQPLQHNVNVIVTRIIMTVVVGELPSPQKEG